MRRVKRDVHERGRSIDSILTQYERFVKPSYHKYIITQKHKSDIIVPNGGENMIAIDCIKNYVLNNTF
jgi:uridine kinase